MTKAKEESTAERSRDAYLEKTTRALAGMKLSPYRYRVSSTASSPYGEGRGRDMYTVTSYRRVNTQNEIAHIKEVVTWEGVLRTRGRAGKRVVDDESLAFVRIECDPTASTVAAPRLVRFERRRRMPSKGTCDGDLRDPRGWLTLDELKHVLFYGDA